MDILTQLHLEVNAYLAFSINLILDDREHRFKVTGDKGSEKSGWYKGSDLGHKATVTIGDWRTREKKYFAAYADSKSINPSEVATQKKERSKKQALQKLEDSKKQCIALNASNKLFDELKPSSELHAYVESKRLESNYNARVDDRNTLIVPLVNIEGQVQSYQRIFWDSEDSKFSKRFAKGLASQGAMAVVGDIATAKEAYLCEGWADAATLHQCSGTTSIAAMSASNLVDVARLIKKKYPELKVTIIADNDDVGREAANAAAKSTKYKTLTPVSAKDISDMYLAEGREQINNFLTREEKMKQSNLVVLDDHINSSQEKAQDAIEAQVDFGHIVPIGYTENRYFLWDKESQRLVAVSRIDLNSLMDIYPDFNFWKTLFPKKTKSGSDIHLGLATAAIKSQCIKSGAIVSQNGRGLGAWRDHEGIVFNEGHRCLDTSNGDEFSMKLNDGQNFYLPTTEKRLAFSFEIATSGECQKIVDLATSTFSFETRAHLDAMLAYMFAATCPSLLNVRPLFVLEGPMKIGKSKVLDFLAKALRAQIFSADVSADGVKKFLSNESAPILFDEFQAVNDKYSNHLTEVLHLFKDLFTAKDGVISTKGTTQARVLTYITSTIGFVATNVFPEVDDAMQSRIVNLKLKPRAGATNHLASDFFAKNIDPNFSQSLVTRRIKLDQIINDSLAVATDIIAKSKELKDSRQVEVAAFLIVYRHHLTSDGVIRLDQVITAMSGIIALVTSEETVTESQKLIRHLVTKPILIEHKGKKELLSLEQVLESKDKICLKHKGFIVTDDHIEIANNHAVITDMLRGTKWANGWHKVLAAHPNAEKTMARFGGKVSRSVIIKISDLDIQVNV
jgi:putative DNA primase/helicase